MASTTENSPQISVKDLLRFVRQSQLIESIDCDQLEAEFLPAAPQSTAASVASELVDRKMLTRWQADKLLQSKYRSFQLGKYMLQGLVGKGGMSTVYLAEHRVMKRQCALKVLPTRRVRDASWLGRFHREAQVGASLDHPNIIRTYDVDFVLDGKAEVHFIVMEYVDGDDLRKLVERNGPFDQCTAADYIRQSADGLAHAHQAGLVHRDIKPANLLLDKNDTIRLMDLGLVTAFEDEGDNSLTRAHDEKVIGTADYLSPEQALDSHLVDTRSDLYGLGGTLYFLLTGRPPFNQGSLAQRILAHQTKEPDSLSNLVPDMNRDLESIVRGMMKKDPKDRFQSAQDVAAALTRWLSVNGSAAWKTRNARLLESLPPAPQLGSSSGTPTEDDSSDEYIPIAQPVIPDFESPYTSPEKQLAGPAIISSPAPSESSVLNEVNIEDGFADTGLSSLRKSNSDRGLLVVAVAMSTGFALWVLAVVFGWL
ncbi:MAG: serine/threonine-protein kinase [Planctomycetaceae bacterium]